MLLEMLVSIFKTLSYDFSTTNTTIHCTHTQWSLPKKCEVKELCACLRTYVFGLFKRTKAPPQENLGYVPAHNGLLFFGFLRPVFKSRDVHHRNQLVTDPQVEFYQLVD